jgi:hypothetical protein
MDDSRSPSGDTSNDVLFRLQALHSTDTLNYRIIAQSESEVRDIQNAPAISMSYFITQSDQTKLLATLSIYSQRGETRDQVRLLYMNDVAFSIWKAMGKEPRLSAHNIDHHRRPFSRLASRSVSKDAALLMATTSSDPCTSA